MGEAYPPTSSPAHRTALPRKAGKSQKIDFCFSTVCWIFIDKAAAGASIRVTRREMDQATPTQPGAFLGWVDLPCARCCRSWALGLGLG